MEITEPKTSISVCSGRLHVLTCNLWNAKHINKKEFDEFKNLINNLDDIHDSLEFYDNHPLYLLLHRELHRLFKQPVPVSSFLIRINLRPGNHVPALLTFDLFPKEIPKSVEPFEFG